MANEGFLGGFAQGMSPAIQRMMYAQALRNMGVGKGGGGDTGWTDTTGQGATVPPSASWWQRNMPSWAGGASPSGTPATSGDPMMQVLPGTASWAAAAGNRPLTNAVPMPYAPPSVGPTSPAVTPQQQAPVRRPMFTPPIPPGQAPGSGAYAWPPFTNAPSPTTVPTNPGASVWGTPPVPVNAGDVGAGSLLYQPGAMGYGALGSITGAPGRAGNFQNQFGFGAPGTNQRYRKWFTERYGQPPGNNTASR